MKLETPLIALALGALVFTGVFTVFTGIANEYDVDYSLGEYQSMNDTVTIQDAFQRVNETKTRIETIENDFSGETLKDTGSVFGFVRLALSTGRQVLSSLDIFTNMMNVAAQVLGVPPLIVGALTSIVMIILIITIIMVIAGRSY